MNPTTKPLTRIITVCVISGLISGIIVNLLFWFVFSSAWLFFIIPAVMGWSIQRFAKIPKEHLLDEPTFEKLKKQTAWTCAAMVLLFILIDYIPLIIFFVATQQIEFILFDIPFIAVCVLSVIYGYNRGQRCVVDTWSDMLVD